QNRNRSLQPDRPDRFRRVGANCSFWFHHKAVRPTGLHSAFGVQLMLPPALNPMNTKLTLVLLTLAAQTLVRADIFDFFATLDGPSEVTPNNSPGHGDAFVEFDTTAKTMRVAVTFADLVGTTTASHIHAPTTLPFTGGAGVATQTPTFINFPLGV